MLETIFKEFAERVSYGIDTGVSIEIKDFFEGNENVKQYILEVADGKKYKISVKLKTYNIQEVKKIFSDFLHFVEYSGASFYVRKTNIECIEYFLLSVDNDDQGLYCHLIFR